MRLRIVISLIIAFVFAQGVYPAAADPVAVRDFEDEDWADGLVDMRATDLTRTEPVPNGFAGNALQVTIPEGAFRGFGPFDRLPIPVPDEAWYRYHVRLLSWNSADSGKLPGLSGSYSSSAKGCIPSTPDEPGWSARGLFGAAGSNGAPPGQVPIGTYLYHLDQATACGDSLYWGGAYLRPGRWQCVEGHVKLNTPGANDGLVDGWLDGTKRFTKTGIAFRRAEEPSIGIREMWLNVYFGGSWPTPNSLGLTIDQIVVSTEGKVGCLDPFTDDNQSLHRDSITELHARGLLYGCGFRLACPYRDLTRGEVAALIARVLALPPSTRDFFTDDNGHVFEDVINKLAAAGITVGCAPGEFCPDRNLTRAEFATMTVRALGLPHSGGDAFTDDNGHWAETNINFFADAGLTKGCGGGRFCPNRTLTREEAASFFVRIDDLIQPLAPASVEPPPDWPPPGDPPPIPPDERD
jgi:hypothetical protein